MEVNREKLQILLRFGMLVQQNPLLTFVVGLLAGAVGRVHFVRSLEGAPIAIELSQGRAVVWPGPPLKVSVHGVAIGDPMSLGAALSLSTDPICVRFRCEPVERSEAYQRLVVDSYSEVAAGRPAEVQVRERRVRELRSQIDRALDVYNECVRLLETAGPERREELQAFLHIAEQELQACGRELKALEQELARVRAGS